MSLKEFDAKQFLLEKGERVGLGVAVTLMVLMLILSLFMPSKGFFSGSPAGKAKELNNTTADLDNRLKTSQPQEKDLPEKREGKLIAFNTSGLDTDNYGTELFFEPRMKENSARRPPKIYNVEEAVAQVAFIPVDTYMIRPEANPPAIMVLQDKDRKVGGGPAPGGPGGAGAGNPFAALMRGMPGMQAPGARGGPGGSAMQRQQQQVFGRMNNLGGLNRLMSAADNTEYEIRWLPLDDWNSQQLTARRLWPLRMAIIAGSFPYKKQLEEHKNRLRLKSTDEVLGESITVKDPKTEKDTKVDAFDFRGVEVERMEVDANGTPIGDWIDPDLNGSYKLWLERTYVPFQPEDAKYEAVEPNGGRGLVMPLLREFRAYKPDAPGLPGMMLPGMMPGGKGGGMFPGMMPGGKGMPPPPNAANAAAKVAPAADENKGRYPDVAADLPLLKKTLDDIQAKQPKQIAQATKFQQAGGAGLNVFDRNSAEPDQNQNPNPNAPAASGSTSQESYVPDYILVRVVDVNIEPGKYYKYRLKVKMANPNYRHDDVASPEYKLKETLESSDWWPMPQIVTAPPEQSFYVVDEAHGMNIRAISQAAPAESAQYRMLRASRPSPTDEQVAFQFHRWIESAQQSRKETEPIPVGEWAVADRVFVARGEYIGRRVNVDIPIWKYTQNRYILPALPDAKINRRAGGKVNTGIDVDFGQDPPESNMILVDFAGGRGVQLPSNSKIKDDCAIEVLMLSPEGKLLARNSAKDTEDQKRKERREAVLKRIQDVREGKGTD